MVLPTWVDRLNSFKLAAIKLVTPSKEHLEAHCSFKPRLLPTLKRPHLLMALRRRPCWQALLQRPDSVYD